MLVHVHPSSGVPLYLQIESQLKTPSPLALSSPATRCCPVRQLAAEQASTPTPSPAPIKILNGMESSAPFPAVDVRRRKHPGLLKSEKCAPASLRHAARRRRNAAPPHSGGHFEARQRIAATVRRRQISEWAILTENLAKHYGKLAAVDGLDLHVPKGSVMISRPRWCR